MDSMNYFEHSGQQDSTCQEVWRDDWHDEDDHYYADTREVQEPWWFTYSEEDSWK